MPHEKIDPHHRRRVDTFRWSSRLSRSPQFRESSRPFSKSWKRTNSTRKWTLTQIQASSARSMFHGTSYWYHAQAGVYDGELSTKHPSWYKFCFSFACYIYVFGQPQRLKGFCWGLPLLVPHFYLTFVFVACSFSTIFDTPSWCNTLYYGPII